MSLISRTTLDLDLGAFGTQEVKILYVYTSGMPQLISDHWGGSPEEPPFVELIGATFLQRDVLPLLTEEALDDITERILALEGDA